MRDVVVELRGVGVRRGMRSTPISWSAIHATRARGQGDFRAAWRGIQFDVEPPIRLLTGR